MAFWLCLAFANALFAQKRWTVGAVFTPQYSTYYNAADFAQANTTPAPTFGVALGAAIDCTLGTHWHLASGINYSQQGQNYRSNPAIALRTNTYQRALEYLKIPILVGYHAALTPHARWLVRAGLQADILTDAHYYRDGAVYGTYAEPNLSVAEKTLYQPANIAAVAATGVHFFTDNHLYVSVLVKADYTLSPTIDNTTNTFWQQYSAVERLTQMTDERSASHNTTVGLELGVGYWFE